MKRETQIWICLGILVVLGHWAGDEVFHTAEHVLHGEWHGVTLWALPPVVGVLMTMWAIFILRLGNPQRITSKHRSAIVYGSATTIVSVGAAASMWRTLAAWAHGWSIQTEDYAGGIAYCSLFVALMLLLYRRRRDLGAVVEFPQQKKSESRRHLILFLSNVVTGRKNGEPFVNAQGQPLYVDAVPRWFIEDEAQCLAAGQPVGIDAALKSLLRLKDADDRRKWNWEMPLRAIQHHRPKLEHVTVVCSPASLKQVGCFLNLAERYFKKIKFAVWAEQEVKAEKESATGRSATTRFRRLPSAEAKEKIADLTTPDFEELDLLAASVGQLLDHLTETPDLRLTDQDIVIDFTGGQKTTSIVAASITFNRPISAQYVRTEGEFKQTRDDIVSFDLSIEPVGAGPG